MMSALAFRSATASDAAFAVESWLEANRAAWTAGLIQMGDWYSTMRPQAEKLFRRPGSHMLVAYKPDESEPGADVYGWLAQEKGHPWPYVVFVYVKSAYRRLGIARRLFQEARIDPQSAFRHATWLDKALVEKVPRARWSPLTVRFERKATEHEQGRAAGRP